MSNPRSTGAVGARPMGVGLVLLAAAGTFAVTMGARQSMGLFLSSINSSTGLGIASISLAFAFGQLWWGLTQPFAGIVADRIGAGRVLVLGVVLIAIGTALVPMMSTTGGLIFAIGVLSAGGAGMAGPSVLMAATTRLMPPERRGMATGIVNAGGSFGQFVFAPIAQGLTAVAGWAGALQGMALITLFALPAAWVLRGSGQGAASVPSATGVGAASAPASGEGAGVGVGVGVDAGAGTGAGAGAGAGAPPVPRLTTRQAVAQAVSDPRFRLLAAGFFVCGFHVAFIATHLPGVVASCQLSPAVGAWALGVIGLFNIVGSLGIGWAISFQGGRWRMKSLLSLIYAARAVAVLVFMLLPKTPTVMLVFAAVIGLTYLSTVPPTAGLVAKFFGPANMGTLFGVVMLTHQLGGFLGAYLGGKAFEARGNYDWMWYADIVLAVGAALIHLPIRESRRVAPRVATA